MQTALVNPLRHRHQGCCGMNSVFPSPPFRTEVLPLASHLGRHWSSRKWKAQALRVRLGSRREEELETPGEVQAARLPGRGAKGKVTGYVQRQPRPMT